MMPMNKFTFKLELCSYTIKKEYKTEMKSSINNKM